MNQAAQGVNQDSDQINAVELTASINEFNEMLSEIAVLEMRLLFKKASESVTQNFTAAVKKKFYLQLITGDENHQCAN